MASSVSHLPHIKNVQAGINHWDPMYKAIFEVFFTLPDAITTGQEDAILLGEQVFSVSGLNALNKTTIAGHQKFLGVDVSYLQPTLEETFATITIVFNLNLRNGNDNYAFKMLKAWSKLGYNMADGTRTLKADYIADNLRIAEANRDGVIWRSVIFHDILLQKVDINDDLNYTEKEHVQMTCEFISDYWDEEIA